MPNEKLAIEKKIELYSFARDMFNNGKSYPQVIELLSESCGNEEAEYIAQKGLDEEWDKLYETARKLFGEGKTYAEVVENLRLIEKDEELISYVANMWYELKSIEVESIVEGSRNVTDGLLWVVIGGIGAIAVFYFNASIFNKVIWSIAFVGALAQYFFGRIQNSTAKRINKLLKKDEQD
jgi:hypothetical protein